MRVKVLVSFNGMKKGDTATVEGDAVALARAYANAGLMEVTDDGESETGPRRPAESDPAGVTEGTPDSGTSGDQPGEGFGSGGYGTAEGEYSG